MLAEVGGLEHAALAGFVLGAAAARVPVMLDGVIAGSAALVAAALCPTALRARPRRAPLGRAGRTRSRSTHLGLRPLVDLDLRLGEGTGALLALPARAGAARALRDVATFDSAGVTEKVSATPRPTRDGAVYPVGLRLAGRRVVVVGGGQVAHRRVAGLLEAGADVTVVSPEVTPALEALVAPGLGHLGARRVRSRRPGRRLVRRGRHRRPRGERRRRRRGRARADLLRPRRRPRRRPAPGPRRSAGRATWSSACTAAATRSARSASATPSSPG